MKANQILVFLLIFFISMLLISENKISDIYFHTELVNRINNNESLNDPMSFVVDNWRYDNETRNWTAEYVENYPKAFHYIASVIPFEAERSVYALSTLLFSLLLIGIILLCMTLGLSFEVGSIAAGIFFLASKLPFVWNYGFYYVNGVYSQLLLNVVLVFGAALIIYVWRKNKKLVIIPTILVIFLVLMSHSVPNISKIIDNAARFEPLIFCLLIPIALRLGFSPQT